MTKVQLDKNKIKYDGELFVSDSTLEDLANEYNGTVLIRIKLIYRDGTYSIIMPKIEYIKGSYIGKKFVIRSYSKYEIHTAEVHFDNNDDALQFRLSYQN